MQKKKTKKKQIQKYLNRKTVGIDHSFFVMNQLFAAALIMK